MLTNDQEVKSFGVKTCSEYETNFKLLKKQTYFCFTELFQNMNLLNIKLNLMLPEL